jgi:hypothetical protein
LQEWLQNGKLMALRSQTKEFIMKKIIFVITIMVTMIFGNQTIVEEEVVNFLQDDFTMRIEWNRGRDTMVVDMRIVEDFKDDQMFYLWNQEGSPVITTYYRKEKKMDNIIQDLEMRGYEVISY